MTRNERFAAWFADRSQAQRIEVKNILFRDMDKWGFEEGTGNLVHASGRFFTISGLCVQTQFEPFIEWSQPIINQPEIGILGLVARDFGGILHFLVQAKTEPGNVNGVQISPTVQATYSNYSGVHRGSPVRYLECFVQMTASGRARVLVDVLQSEQGAWYWCKRNRNMIVEVFEDLPGHEDFCWLTLGQIQQLLGRDNVVNMDARSVLACIPFTGPAAEDGTGALGDGLSRSMRPSEGVHTLDEIDSWLRDMKTRQSILRSPINLADVAGWRRGPGAITHEEGRHFSVEAVEITANSREVSRWTQPLLQPVAEGVVAFLVRDIGGVTHVLLHAKTEPGLVDMVELAPTVQGVSDSYRGLSADRQPRYLDYVLAIDPARVVYETRLSEEGGRFLHAVNRYMVVDTGDDVPVDVVGPYRWVTLGQLTELIRHSYYLNMQARTVLACLHALWGGLAR
ncbi:NDP-hexose 2,3-dehydratase family protein [Crossiella sp. CA-258035]|uniref:NDP-hexose 2,3-dehydratase family protein n=1 Tax=Crossiella sp. CA-258035 TaxID=2981138 RepID=UPI0024BC65C0|nr:NDP-hexose 2,3-dehydratase family protein [Crossiella sp. CA-258035]WHT23338.1 NDP-hexose 2,3-dehydratase family protein [Crossiella sp. CA-258035]